MAKLGERSFGAGIHALSHAILAVIPSFVPGVARQDLECDHSYFNPTRIMLFDERAGGSGVCEGLWDLFFQPGSILEAAVDLLDDCPTCSPDVSYDGGCPACLHAPHCINFNTHLSRNAGAIIGKNLLERIKTTDKYKTNTMQTSGTDAHGLDMDANDATPRRKAREKGLRMAMRPVRSRQFVVGRPSWPLDG